LWNPTVNPSVHSCIDLKIHRIYRHLGLRFMTDIRLAGTGFEARHLPWLNDDGWPEDEKAFYKAHRAHPTLWTTQQAADSRKRRVIA
jgi:hypothetical protein